MAMSSARTTPHTPRASARQITERTRRRDTVWAALTVAQGNTQLLRRAIARGRALDLAEVDRRLATIEAATAKAVLGVYELETHGR